MISREVRFICLKEGRVYISICWVVICGAIGVIGYYRRIAEMPV